MKILNPETIKALAFLTPWMPAAELATLAESAHGEEGADFESLLCQWATKISAMPVTGETDGTPAIAILHYYLGGCDWWIIEKDIEGGTPQAFGYACLNDPEMAEYGYISIDELVSVGAELDLYFEPTSLADIKRKLREGAAR